MLICQGVSYMISSHSDGFINKADAVKTNTANVTHHLGTHTLVRVGVLDNDVKPWDGNRFHAITPRITS